MTSLEGYTLPKNTRDPTLHKNQVNNNNILTGTNVMPMKSQTASNNQHFSLMRKIYLKSKSNPDNNTEKRGKNSLYQDHSLYLQRKKAQAVGKQSYSETLSYNSNNYHDTKTARKLRRSSGYTVPSKVTNKHLF